MGGNDRKNRGHLLTPWMMIDVLLLLAGGGLALFGYNEYAAGVGASTKAVPAELAELEAGKPLPDKHIVIGRHIAVHTAGFYSFHTERGVGAPKPKPDDRLDHTYFPIISESHPYLRRLTAISDKYGGFDKVPPTEPLPQLNDFVILVKSRSYNTVSQLPNRIRAEPRVQGMVVKGINSLGYKEQQLLRESLPNADFDKVVILEEGRRPTSPDEAQGVMLFGACVAMAGIGLFGVRFLLWRRRTSRIRSRRADDVENGDFREV